MNHIFGPVPSRRLGYSLGVDLVVHKTCTFDCLYCECGPTTSLTIERKEYVPFDELADELGETFKDPPERLDYVTLSGSGEPCLNTRMGDVLELLRSISPAKVAVLTNSSLLTDPEVRRELGLAHVVAPSLDTAVPETFNLINRPHPSLSLGAMVKGLVEFRRGFGGEIRLEVLLVKGVNDSPGELERLARQIELIRPDTVDVNTAFRPGAARLKPLTQEELESAARGLGPLARPVGSFCGDGSLKLTGFLEKRVVALISRRPCTLDELAESLAAGEKEVREVLKDLEKRGVLKTQDQKDGRFYSIVV